VGEHLNGVISRHFGLLDFCAHSSLPSYATPQPRLYHVLSDLSASVACDGERYVDVGMRMGPGGGVEVPLLFPLLCCAVLWSDSGR